MTERVIDAELRIRTEPFQMADVITQIGKEFEMTPIGAEGPTERLFTITPRIPRQTLPQISVLVFDFGDSEPVNPAKLRSAFCNQVYAGLAPYSQVSSTKNSGLQPPPCWRDAKAWSSFW
jgi:hypothetical protein